MNTRLLACCLFLVGGLLAQNASAASMRCGNHLIQDGARHGVTKYEVLKKCGEPAAKMGYTWIYKRGNRTQRLQFNGSGRLLTISDQ